MEKTRSSVPLFRRILSLVLSFVLLLGMVPVTHASAAEDTTLYLKPNANWLMDGARFAVYYWNDSESYWDDLLPTEDEGIYECTIPAGYSNIIFCRMNPNTETNDWTNKWNQTSDLTVPTDGTNLYTVADGSWDNGSGTWSAYGVEEEPDETTSAPTTVPATTEGSDVEEELYIVAGDSALCGSNWAADDAANRMSLTSDGTYQKVYPNVAAGTYNLKVTNGTWDRNWGDNGQNYTFVVSAVCDVTVTFDPSSGTVSVTGDHVGKETGLEITSMVAVGNGSGTWLNGENWNVASTANAMTEVRDNVYEITFEDVSAGTAYEFKFAANGAWTHSWGSGGAAGEAVYNGQNIKLSIDYALADVTLQLDMTGYNHDSKTGAVYSVTVTEAVAEPTVDYYLIGYINNADYGCNDDWENLGDYKFADGKLTAKFDVDSYVFIKTGDNASWFMTQAYAGSSPATFYNTTSGASEKLFVPGGVELEFTLVENEDGSLTLSYAEVVTEPAVDYYLIGYINNADYGCNDDWENLGEYKFEDGKLTAKFDADSYVFIKTGDNASWFMTQAYAGSSPATFYNTTSGSAEKLFVPGGVELEFTLVENEDGSLTLSYAEKADTCDVTLHFYKPETWGSTINAYLWTSGGAVPGYSEHNAWPGKPISANAEHAGWYDLVVSTASPMAFNFIFNDGVNQTGDLYTGDVTGDTELWIVGNDVSTTAPGEWSGDYDYTAYLHFQKPESWGDTVNAWIWDANGKIPGYEEYNTTWPGAPVEACTINPGWYNVSVTMDENAGFSFIFNDGTNQTADLSTGTLEVKTHLWIVDGQVLTAAPDGWKDPSRTLHVPGTFPGPSWDAASNQMTWDPELELYVYTFENVPPANYEYKISVNGSWNENYGAGAVRDGSNIAVAVPETMDVTIYYNDETHNSVCSVTYIFADVTLSGTGIPAGTKLTDKGLTGIYSATVPMTAGVYTDLVITCDGKTYSFAEIEIEEDKDVTFFMDPVTEIFYSDASDIPVDTAAIFFDSQDARYKQPFGAAATGEEITFAIDTGADVTSAVLVVKGIGSYPMTEEVTETGKRWTAAATFANIGEYDYYFSLSNGSTVVIYSDDDGYYGVGKVSDLTSAQPYDLVVYKAGFETPDWVKDAVIYQIFPDRFFDGDVSNNQAQTWARGEVNYEYITDWYTLPENPEQEALLDQATYESTGAHWGDGEWSNEIYGGDLDGIIQRIDYLKALGVNVIYLNPIFWSISNHRYDAVDYTEIDPILGTMGDFKQLVSVAEANGMHIILDGVFNHVSDDSVYFDRYYKFLGTSNKIGAYPYWAYVYDYMDENNADKAAAEAAAKAFFTAEYGITDYSYTAWFSVSSTTMAGTVDNVGLRAGKEVYSYEGWWGYDSMPVIYSTNGSEYQTGNWAQEIIHNSANTSVTQYWITRGNNGWRLDVANEVSDETWQRFRDSVKALDSDAVIIGEIWDDATKYLKGDMYDSVMNYLFRNASTGFAMGTGAEETMKTLEKIRERYPEEAFYAMMNLVGSHDTTRLLSYLDGIGDDRNDKSISAAFPTYEDTSDTAKERQYLVAFLQFTYAGAPTIYYGDEIGMVGADDPDDRRGMEWGRGDQAIVEWYAKLAAIRAAYPALRTGSVSPLDLNNNNLLAYVRQDATNTLTVIANNSANDQTAQLEGEYIDLVTGEAFDGTVPGRCGVILVTEDQVKPVTVNYAGLAPAYDPAYEVAERPEGIHVHSYEAVVTEPDCVNSGYTTFTCECGDSYISREVPALGHDEEAVVTAPDCVNGGYTTYTCTVCGESRTGDEVPALGHDYSYTDADGIRTYTCGRCGDSYETPIYQVISGKNLNLKVTDPETGKQIGNGKLNWAITECLVTGPDGTDIAYEDVSAYATLKNGTLKTLKCGDKVTLTVTATLKTNADVSFVFTVEILPAANKLALWSGDQPVVGTYTWDVNGVTPADKDSWDLDAFAYPGNAGQAVTWKSSNTGLIEIDENGTMTLAAKAWDAKKEVYKTGSVTITATANDGSGKKATLKINLARLAHSIEISRKDGLAEEQIPYQWYYWLNEETGVSEQFVEVWGPGYYATAGEKLNLTAALDPNASAKGVIWECYSAHAKVSSSGVVTVSKNAPTDATIYVYAYSKDGNAQDMVRLFVRNASAKVNLYSMGGFQFHGVSPTEGNVDVSTATADMLPYVELEARVMDADSNIIQELTRYEDWSVSNENIAQLKIFPFWWDGYETENGWYSFRNYDLTNMPEGTKPFHQIKVYPVWNQDKDICSTGSVTVTGTASDGKASASYKINFVNMVNSLEIRTKDDKNLFPAEPETYWNPWNQWDPAEGAYVGGWHEGNVVRATAGETVKLIGVTNANAKNKKLAWYAECASCPDAVKISNGSLTIAKDLPGETLIWVCAQTCDNSYLETWIPVVAAPRATNVHLRAELNGGMKYVSNSTRNWDVNTDGKVLNLSALVYPFAAAQDVTWTVNNKGIATVTKNADGTATLNFTGTKFGKLVVTATANDGSKEKTSFTLNVVNSVISLDLNSGLSVVGGKSLNLSKELTIDPAKPTNKKVTWTMLMKDSDGNLVEVPKTVATLSTSGSLSTKKITDGQNIELVITVTAQDGYGAADTETVVITPAT